MFHPWEGVAYLAVLQSGVMGPPTKKSMGAPGLDWTGMGPPTNNLVKRPGQDCYFYVYSR